MDLIERRRFRAQTIRAERRKNPIQHIDPLAIELRRRNEWARIAAAGRIKVELTLTEVDDLI